MELPLALENYHEGIISVVRIGDPTDQHWPVRWFAAWTNNDQTLGGFVELEHEKVEMAKFEEILENPMSSKIDCYFGECPNQPNLEFYVQYHPLQPKSQWGIPSKKVQISEKTESRTNAPPTPELTVPALQNQGGNTNLAPPFGQILRGVSLFLSQPQPSISSPGISQPTARVFQNRGRSSNLAPPWLGQSFGRPMSQPVQFQQNLSLTGIIQQLNSQSNPQQASSSIKVQGSEKDESRANIQPTPQLTGPNVNNQEGTFNAATAALATQAFGEVSSLQSYPQPSLSAPQISQPPTTESESQLSKPIKDVDDHKDDEGDTQMQHDTEMQLAPQAPQIILDQGGSSNLAPPPGRAFGGVSLSPSQPQPRGSSHGTSQPLDSQSKLQPTEPISEVENHNDVENDTEMKDDTEMQPVPQTPQSTFIQGGGSCPIETSDQVGE